MSKYLIENYPVYYELFAEKTFTWDRTGGTYKTRESKSIIMANVGVDE